MYVGTVHVYVLCVCMYVCMYSMYRRQESRCLSGTLCFYNNSLAKTSTVFGHFDQRMNTSESAVYILYNCTKHWAIYVYMDGTYYSVIVHSFVCTLVYIEYVQSVIQ